MKVFNLRCAHEHMFEGWFASEADFQSQRLRGLLVCPVCEDKEVRRLPSAPRLNVCKERDANPTNSTGGAAEHDAANQARWLQSVREVIAKTEDVGERFPEEARRIHYGEAQERAIRGMATPADAQALSDEGIEIMTMHLPAPIKSSLQ